MHLRGKDYITKPEMQSQEENRSQLTSYYDVLRFVLFYLLTKNLFDWTQT